MVEKIRAFYHYFWSQRLKTQVHYLFLTNKAYVLITVVVSVTSPLQKLCKYDKYIFKITWICTSSPVFKLPGYELIADFENNTH